MILIERINCIKFYPPIHNSNNIEKLSQLSLIKTCLENVLHLHSIFQIELWKKDFRSGIIFILIGFESGLLTFSIETSRSI